MKKETQRTKDLIEENLDYMFNVQKELTIGRWLLQKYVMLEQVGDTTEIETTYSPEKLKDYCKTSMRFLMEEQVKWSKVEWDIIGEWLKEQPKAEEWTQIRIDEYKSYL